jgi:hypothetical protein
MSNKADDFRGLFYACLLGRTLPNEQPLTQAAEEAAGLMATFKAGRAGQDESVVSVRLYVRLYGEHDDRDGWKPCLYHGEITNVEEAAPRLAKRWATEIRKRRSRPTKTRLRAAERKALVRVYFPVGDVRVLSGTQGRVDLPGGARLNVYGDEDHTVQIDHLSTQQLATVLHAIAETLDPKGKR